ncbi:MAG: UDP-N-acetylglucosamine 2-epimerase, partial [Planctomycetota bacterium]
MDGGQRRIAVVTGTRAEWGLLLPVVRALGARGDAEAGVVIAGWHLAAGTAGEVERQAGEAGVGVWGQAAMQEAGVTGRWADAAALGRGVSAVAGVLAGLEGEVDWVVVLGDRVEALAGAAAAAVGGVRVAHLHGGDRAEGVADESMLHAISKLA